MATIQFNSGWKKDSRDERDFLHMTAAPQQILPAVNYYNLLPARRNQGSVSSCTGHGIGVNITAIAVAQKADAEWESPTWIYNLGRAKENMLPYDTGAYPRDCLDQLVKYGLLKEHFWPYNGNTLDKTDPTTRMGGSRKYPDFAYFRCVDGIDGVLSALSAGHLVSIGAPWFQKWFQPLTGGILQEVVKSDPIAGGHETCLYGYDQVTGFLFGVNSWGAGWGDNGCFKMPFSALQTFKDTGNGYDAHYIEVTMTNPQPPSPDPEPIKPKRCWFFELLSEKRALAHG